MERARVTHHRTVLAAAAAAVLVLAAASSAHAASGTWSSGGQAGVHAQGSWETKLSKIYFSGYVRDTACDGHSVKINISFQHDIAGLPSGYRTETVTNTLGCNQNKSFSFNSYQPGQTVSIAVQECVVYASAPDHCSSFHRVVRTQV